MSFGDRLVTFSTNGSSPIQIKAVLGFDAVVGNLASPYTSGSGYVLLHHALGEVNGKPGTWGHAIGGMGAITQAMARAAGNHGVGIDLDAAVREIIVERDRAAGVVLSNGTAFRARAVIANVDPRRLFRDLVPGEADVRASENPDGMPGKRDLAPST